MLDKQGQQTLSTKLKALFEAIMEETGRNPEFADKIERILAAGQSSSVRKSSAKAKEESNFNHVTILQESGVDKLRSELDKFSNEQLSKMSVKFKIFANLKESKKHDRDATVDALVKHAEQRLNVGSVFLRN